ncbi:MAG TPA: hypothetical protein EYH31_04880 [Anaerolineae bacterium]|nr:hypothetical protein [Anaerolineae bacterium]
MPQFAHHPFRFNTGIAVQLLGTLIVAIFACRPLQQPIPSLARTGGSVFPAQRATWVWSDLAKDAEARNQLFQFAHQRRLNRIYVESEHYLTHDPATLADFTTAASEQGLTVEWLLGYAPWALTPYHSELINLIQTAVTTAHSLAPDTRLGGIHLDVEPHALPEWDSDWESTAAQYLDLLTSVRNTLDATSIPLSLTVDIPFWYDNLFLDYPQSRPSHRESPQETPGGERPLHEYVLDIVDRATIMDYRDSVWGSDGIVQHAAAEIAYATSAGKGVVVGVETNDPGSEPEKITFYEEGRLAMERALASVRAHFANQSGFHGTAVHDYLGYAMLPPGPAVSAWMPIDYDTANARSSFEANADMLTEVSPVWYRVESDGSLTPLGGARDAALIATAHAAGGLVIPTIQNYRAGFDPAPVQAIIHDDDLRAAHITNILAEVLTYGYDGIDVDYESLTASDRDAYTRFMSELADALHAQGKLLTTAVHSKESEPGGWSGSQAQDWAALGAVVDGFRIMTYDFCWSTGCDGRWNWGQTPGPIAPLWWVRRVAEFAITQVDPAKVWLSVPWYGYDWWSNGASGLTWLEVQEKIALHDATVHWFGRDRNGLVEQKWFEYDDAQGTHSVWFNDADTLRPKLDLVDELGLAGIAIWRLGSEDSDNWQRIRRWLDPNQIAQPAALAIYYGWPSLVENAGGNVDDATTTFAQFDVVVLGDGLEHASHGDHLNTRQIITSLVDAGIEVYGYVDLGVTTQGLDEAALREYVDEWADIGVTGIFWDDAGYDFGVDRARQTAAISYTHAQGLRAFVNAWNPDDILAADSDQPSPLRPGDWYLAESWLVSNDDYANLNDWVVKADKLLDYRVTTGVRMAAIATGADSGDLTSPDSRFNFAYWGAALYNLDAFSYTNAQYSAYGAMANRLIYHPPPTIDYGNQFTSPPNHSADSRRHNRPTDRGQVVVGGGQYTTGLGLRPWGVGYFEPDDANAWLGVYYGNQGWNVDDLALMEDWQGKTDSVVLLYQGANPDNQQPFPADQLDAIWNDGHTPLVTWELRGTEAITDIISYIHNGGLDAYFSTWAAAAAAWCARPWVVGDQHGRQRSLLLRPFHEMNGNWYPWGQQPPAAFIAAWQRIHDRFVAAGVGPACVRWVWSVNNVDVGSHIAEEYYPGDAYVDWVAVDGYNWGLSQPEVGWDEWLGAQFIVGPMLHRLSTLAPNKPQGLTEFASSSVVQTTSSGPDEQGTCTGAATKAQWITDAYTTVLRAYPNLRLVIYFNEDKAGCRTLRPGESDWAVFTTPNDNRVSPPIPPDEFDPHKRVEAYANAVQANYWRYEFPLTAEFGTEAPCYVGDLNCNSAADVIDVQTIAARWNAAAGSPLYDPWYDLDGNGVVDVADIERVADAWGWVAPTNDGGDKTVFPW